MARAVEHHSWHGCRRRLDTVRLSKKAARAGARACWCMPPFYYKNPSEEGLYRSLPRRSTKTGEGRLRVTVPHPAGLTVASVRLQAPSYDDRQISSCTAVCWWVERAHLCWRIHTSPPSRRNDVSYEASAYREPQRQTADSTEARRRPGWKNGLRRERRMRSLSLATRRSRRRRGERGDINDRLATTRHPLPGLISRALCGYESRVRAPQRTSGI